MDKINQRFRDGAPSNDLAAGGILIHQFDGADDSNPSGTPWSPFSDRISASMVYGKMRPDERKNIPIYSFSTSGIILSPQYNQMLCGYAYDVGSFSRQCWGAPGCIPGCSVNGGLQWCQPGNDPWPCAWHPDSLIHLMRSRENWRRYGNKPPDKYWDDHKFYDELIFDADYFRRHLPKSIEAVFFIHGDCWDVGDSANNNAACEEYARRAHANIVRHFRLKPGTLPLLKLDLFNWNEPFTDVHEEAKAAG